MPICASIRLHFSNQVEGLRIRLIQQGFAVYMAPPALLSRQLPCWLHRTSIEFPRMLFGIALCYVAARLTSRPFIAVLRSSLRLRWLGAMILGQCARGRKTTLILSWLVAPVVQLSVH